MATIDGTVGDDSRIGTTGADLLTGGAGRDFFTFGALDGGLRSLAQRTVIRDFALEDCVDFGGLGLVRDFGSLDRPGIRTYDYYLDAGRLNGLINWNLTGQIRDPELRGCTGEEFSSEREVAGSRQELGVSRRPAITGQ